MRRVRTITCRLCGTPLVRVPRGTTVNCCKSCLKALSAAHHNGTPAIPTTPTTARPGTEEKIVVMEERYRKGEALHHPDDVKCLAPSVYEVLRA